MSQRDGLGSASHAPRYRTSGTKGTVDIPAVVQRWGVVPEGPEGTASWVIATTLPVFPEELARDAWRGQWRNRTKQKLKILHPALLRGKEWRCLRVAHVRAAWSTSSRTSQPGVTRGAPLSCAGLDAPASKNSQHGAELA